MQKLNLEKLNVDKFSRNELQNIKGSAAQDGDPTHVCMGGDGYATNEATGILTLYCLP